MNRIWLLVLVLVFGSALPVAAQDFLAVAQAQVIADNFNGVVCDTTSLAQEDDIAPGSHTANANVNATATLDPACGGATVTGAARAHAILPAAGSKTYEGRLTTFATATGPTASASGRAAFVDVITAQQDGVLHFDVVLSGRLTGPGPNSNANGVLFFDVDGKDVPGVGEGLACFIFGVGTVTCSERVGVDIPVTAGVGHRIVFQIEARAPAGFTADFENTATLGISGVPFTSASGVESSGTTAPLAVAIDIKPGSLPNSINPRSHGTIPVAVLSTAAFSAPDEVDASSLTFGGTGDEQSLAFCHPEDVNADGRPDLMCHFHTPTAAFVAGQTEGILKGRTRSGTAIEGRDSVRLVPVR